MSLRDSIPDGEDSIFVYFYENAVNGKVIDHTKPTPVRDAVLTTSRSESSYRIPVLVFDDDGPAYGPADVVGSIDAVNRNTTAGKTWLKRAKEAGFNV